MNHHLANQRMQARGSIVESAAGGILAFMGVAGDTVAEVVGGASVASGSGEGGEGGAEPGDDLADALSSYMIFMHLYRNTHTRRLKAYIDALNTLLFLVHLSILFD